MENGKGDAGNEDRSSTCSVGECIYKQLDAKKWTEVEWQYE